MESSTEVSKSECVVVADAGPIIHLDELDALDVLRDFPQILVAPAVHRELLSHRPNAVVKCAQFVFTYPPPSSDALKALASRYSLHRGESEALALCLQHQPSLLLSDDTAARLAAKSLNVEAHGTIGLLLRAVRKQHRNATKVIELLEAIPSRSTLHIRPALLREVIDQAREAWGS